eukprot:scaffold30374_cov107-Isochrysis_galbana.AAC.11
MQHDGASRSLPCTSPPHPIRSRTKHCGVRSYESPPGARSRTAKPRACRLAKLVGRALLILLKDHRDSRQRRRHSTAGVRVAPIQCWLGRATLQVGR